MAPAFDSRAGQRHFQPSRRARRTSAPSARGPVLSSKGPESAGVANVVDTSCHPSGQRVATVQDDDTLTIWRVARGDEWDVEAHFKTRHKQGTVRVVTFAPERLSPAIVVTAGADGLAVVYRLFEESCDGDSDDLVVARETTILDSSQALTDLAFAEDGTLATVGDEHVLRLYQTTDNGERWGLIAAVDVGIGSERAGGVSFAPGGEYCVACGDVVVQGAAEWMWEVCASIPEADPQGREKGRENAVICADWASSGYIGVGRLDGAVEIWQLEEGELSRVSRMMVPEEMESTKVVKIEWNCAGGILATAHDDRVLRLWARMPPDDEHGSWAWELKDKFTLESNE